MSCYLSWKEGFWALGWRAEERGEPFVCFPSAVRLQDIMELSEEESLEREGWADS